MNGSSAGPARGHGLPILLLLLLGTLLLLLANLASSEEALFFDRSGVVSLRLPFVGSPLEFDLADESARIKLVFISLTVLVFVTGLVIGVVRSMTARRAVRSLIADRRNLIVSALSMGVFALAFLPVGGARVLFYFFLGVPGFILFFAGAWRTASWVAQRIGPTLGQVFFGIRARSFIVLVFLITFAITNLVSYFVFEHQPHVVTGIAHVFHARIMASGELYIASHPLKEFFDVGDTVINNGRWYSHFPPGHTVLILLGLWIGTPWLINPLLGSAAVVVFYFLGKELYDERIGRLAALFGVLSPFLIFMSSEFYNHASSLLFCSLFLLFFARLLNRGVIAYGALAGVFLGMAMNTRLLTTLAVSAPFAIYSLYLLAKHGARYLPRLAALVGGVVVFAALLGGFNYATNGHPLRFAYDYSQGHESSGIGFVERQGEEFTPWKGFVNTVNRMRVLNKALFEWPIPSLIFILILFMSRTRNRWDFLLLAVLLSGLVAHYFWYFPGFQFGPRYLYYAMGPMMLLTARGVVRTPELIRDVFKLSVPRATVERVVLVAVVLCVTLAVPFNSYRLVKGFTNPDWDWQIDSELLAALQERDIHNGVVFVRSSFRSVFLENDALDLDNSDVIYANDLGEDRNVALMSYYPNRDYYLADGKEVRQIRPPLASTPGVGPPFADSSEARPPSAPGVSTAGSD